MRFIALLALTAAALYSAPIPAPDLFVDAQQVVSPNVGAAVVPDGSFQLFQVCLNDNPAGAPDNDEDYNDGCADAEFGPGNVLTLTYIGGITAAENYIGVSGQLGWVGASVLQTIFSYTPGVETIFAGYVNGGITAVYLSGSGGALSTPPGDYFYTECVLCSGSAVEDVPEPSTLLLIPLGLAGLALRKSAKFAKK